MDMPGAIVARLRGDSAVASIVGNRIHWMARPQGVVLPAIVLTSSSNLQPQHLDGFDDIKTALVDVNCYAADFGAAWGLAETVIPALIDEAEVQNIIFWRAEVQGPWPLVERTETALIHHAAVEFTIRYSRLT